MRHWPHQGIWAIGSLPRRSCEVPLKKWGVNLSQWWFNQVVILILYKPYLERWIEFKLYLERMIQFDYLYFNNTFYIVLKPPLNVQLSNGVAVWLILLDKIHKHVLMLLYIYTTNWPVFEASRLVQDLFHWEYQGAIWTKNNVMMKVGKFRIYVSVTDHKWMFHKTS